MTLPSNDTPEVLKSILDVLKSSDNQMRTSDNQMRTMSGRMRVMQEQIGSIEAMQRGEYGHHSAEQNLGEGRRQRCGCPLVAHVERCPELP